MEPYNPSYRGMPGPPDTTRPRITFSRTEVIHLVSASALLTVAATVLMTDWDGILERSFDLRGRLPSPAKAFGAALGVLSGFVLHELAHKVVAQYYGHWAEFRAWIQGLFISIAVAFGGLFFAAPGAVMIRGNVTLRENGLISLVGPGTNLLLALLALPFTFATNPGDTIPTVFGLVAFWNSLLCVFNMLPLSFFGNTLDGRKVWWWSKTAYFLMLGAGLTLAIVVFLRTPPS